jgi:hypothetical protein
MKYVAISDIESILSTVVGPLTHHRKGLSFLQHLDRAISTMLNFSNISPPFNLLNKAQYIFSFSPIDNLIISDDNDKKKKSNANGFI